MEAQQVVTKGIEKRQNLIWSIEILLISQEITIKYPQCTNLTSETTSTIEHWGQGPSRRY